MTLPIIQSPDDQYVDHFTARVRAATTPERLTQLRKYLRAVELPKNHRKDGYSALKHRAVELQVYYLESGREYRPMSPGQIAALQSPVNAPEA